MSIRKHNDFLDADQSEEDGSQGYDSEIEDLRKGGRSPKRRKVDSDASEDEDEEQDDKEGEEELEERNTEGTEVPADTAAASSKPVRKELTGVSRPLTKKNLVATEAAVKRSGVVYLSRIPPFMKPQKLRSLLEPYGAIGRIFMTPEDAVSHTRRVRNGGNKKRSFTDG